MYARLTQEVTRSRYVENFIDNKLYRSMGMYSCSWRRPLGCTCTFCYAHPSHPKVSQRHTLSLSHTLIDFM